MTKQDLYFTKLYSHLSEIFNEDCESYINPEDLSEGDNATDFFHALGNLVPAMLYNKLTNQDGDLLHFNYDMNRLICQKTKAEEK